MTHPPSKTPLAIVMKEEQAGLDIGRTCRSLARKRGKG